MDWKTLVFVVTFFGASVGLAQTPPALSDYEGCGYVTPGQLEEANKSLIGEERGWYTTVPLDYEDPSRGTTRIYSYFTDGFDPKRPTYLLFTGGPGQSSHLQISAKFHFYGTLGYNFLMFDQRGIALSRLATEDLARDARNFKSTSTARDVITILDKLGIKKVSVYGASYGTIPATIFASQFPGRTNSLVLEGVVYDGWNGVMKGRYVTQIVQEFYDSLSPEAKDRLDQLIAAKKINDFWLPMMARAFMMQYGTTRFPLFRKAIQETLINRKLETEGDVGTVFNELANEQGNNNAYFTKGELERGAKWSKLMVQEDPCKAIKDSDDLNQLLMLSEFDAGLEHVTSMYVLKDRRIIPLSGANYSLSKSKFTNLKPLSYSASNYPVSVPTFYIQGTADGATPAPGALLHYKRVAKGPAQLLLFKGSAHMPFGLTIADMDAAEDRWQDLQSAFKQMLDGQPVTCATKSNLEKKYPHIDLAISTKGFAEKIRCGATAH